MRRRRIEIGPVLPRFFPDPEDPEGVRAPEEREPRVQPLDVVRERIVHGDPPAIDPPETVPDDQEPE